MMPLKMYFIVSGTRSGKTNQTLDYLRYIAITLLMIVLFCNVIFCQQEGPVILDLKSSSQGVLFPRMTTTQRNAMTEPPNGLFIYNLDDRCLNFYDSIFGYWHCDCNSCQTRIIEISVDKSQVDFNQQYAISGETDYLVIIHPGVNITAPVLGNSGTNDAALSFTNMMQASSIQIINYGSILGPGGSGGSGAQAGSQFCEDHFLPGDGQPGGHAIETKSGVTVTVKNYGIIAGGGGGGGGAGGTGPPAYGFKSNAGGGGAGMAGGPGGSAGSQELWDNTNGGCYVVACSNGASGTATTGGQGANNTECLNTGGNGGDRGQSGQNGTGASNFGSGGSAGKAIAGGSGNQIINLVGGQYFGVID